MVGFEWLSERRELGHVPDETLSGVRGLSTAFPIDQSYRVTDLGLLCSFFKLKTAGVSTRIAGGGAAAPVDADRHVRDSGTAKPLLV